MQESPSTKQHKEHSIKSANVAIITLSDTRNLQTDESGKLIKELLQKENHNILYHGVLQDNKKILFKKIKELTEIKELDAIVTNGGTGLGKRDITIDTLDPLFEKKLTAFQTLFSQLSYKEIGPSSLLSRASAGTINNKVIFCTPGSPRAVELALKKLIIPELGHILVHIKE